MANLFKHQSDLQRSNDYKIGCSREQKILNGRTQSKGISLPKSILILLTRLIPVVVIQKIQK